jgi:hypothetical protein
MLIGELIDMEVKILMIILGCVLSVLGTLIVIIFNQVKNEVEGARSDLSGMKSSVDDLNIKIAEVIKDQSWHKNEIREIKAENREIFARLNSLEKHKGE